jgi:hypothetical protein
VSSFIQRVAIHLWPATTVSAAWMLLGSSLPSGRFDLRQQQQHHQQQQQQQIAQQQQ